ncbi:acyltransferase [Chamaesiphon sp. OTE_75_metabat_556]|uniref:acyltransferase family protein n=1 Tax=Chamaesiphon sp. OTE_75_metabat_556 TaxID=2964692 RepID=UPI00286A5A55|nr:acyltransferase [Chamaesiphon sp. OTE_75_metabat_556]
MKQNSNFNLSIHGLRGLAAILVVFFHVHGMGAKNNALWTSIESIRSFAPFCVCIFFCISGFLIAQTLEKHNSLRIFAKNRLVRIYPVFLVLHLIMFAIGPAKGYDWMGTLKYGSLNYFQAFFANLLFLPGIFDLPIAQKNAWSLSYEALFYILAGLVWKTSTTLRGVAKNLGLIVLAAIIAMAIYTWINAVFFLIGVGCYLIHSNYERQELELVRSSTKSTVFSMKILAFPPLPSTYRLGLPALVIAAIGYAYHPLIAIPFLSIFFVEVVQEDLFSAKILRLRAIQFLGTISYSLYLIHPFVLDLVRSIAVKVAEGNPLLGNLTLIIVGPIVSILVAWFSYELIERKLTKIILAKV